MVVKINKKAVKFAQDNNIYVNEAERVLAGEITLEEAKQITAEFNRMVDAGEVKMVSADDTDDALNECVNLSK